MVAVLAVLAFSNEHSSGMIRTTLAAMPDRLAVLAAKATLLAGRGRQRPRAGPLVAGCFMGPGAHG